MKATNIPGSKSVRTEQNGVRRIRLGTKDITTHPAMRPEAAVMEWIPCSDVEFAECQHGYYFVYKKFDHKMGLGCWFADYEERNNFPESGEERFWLRGLSSIEDTRRECEKHAARNLNSGGPWQPPESKPYCALNRTKVVPNPLT